MDIFDEFLYRLEVNEISGENNRLLCGVSGGPDSIALLDLLIRIREKLHIHVYACHFNHRLRDDESDADERFIRETCEKWGVEIQTGSSDVREFARESGQSIEMAARELRYHFFASAAEKSGCRIIALGHNADDRIENFFLRLFRGSGGRGLGSLKERSSRGKLDIFRPMLQFSRAKIIDYLKFRGIDYRIDSTNFETTTDRGKMRNIVLPELLKIAEHSGFINIRGSILRAAENLSGEDDFIGHFVDKFLEEAVKYDESGFRIDAERMHEIHPALHARIISSAAESYNANLRIDRKHFEKIAGLMDGTSVRSFDIPSGLRVKKSGGEIVFFEPPSDEDVIELEPINFSLDELPDEVIFGRYILRMNRIKNVGRTFTEGNSSSEWIEIDLGAVEGELSIRTPEPGDRIDPLGMNGHSKKLSDIFIDMKVPRDRRVSMPILVDAESGKILGIPPLGLVAESAKVYAGTREILRLGLEELEG